MGLVSFMSQIDLAQKLIMETKLKTNGKWGGTKLGTGVKRPNL